MADMDYAKRLKETGRNDLCPCGSGKKYKRCHLAEDEEAAHNVLAQPKIPEETSREDARDEEAEPQADVETRPRSKGRNSKFRVARPAGSKGVSQVKLPRKASR